MTRPFLRAAALILCLGSVSAAHAATAPTSGKTIAPVDETRLVRLAGNTHPQARAEFDRGPVAGDLRIERVQLVLKRTPAQESALSAYLDRLYDPSSPDFHKWLTPDQFGSRFGVSDAKITQIKLWLQRHGLEVTNVDHGRVVLQFSGTAAQVNEAFHVELHQYLVNGALHIANDRDPQIPASLSDCVVGPASLHNFFPEPQYKLGSAVKRDLQTGKFSRIEPPKTGIGSEGGLHGEYSFTDQNGNSEYDITPYDFATIYNVLPLWNAGYTGTGQKIAVSATSDINLSDVATFRSSFGLPAKAPIVIHDGADPGTSDPTENTLDVEWSGAVAYDASIYLVVSGSTQTSFGFSLSEEYIIDNNVAPIITASYGICELNLGSSGNSLSNQIWQQAATQGISGFDSTGDQGSTQCDSSHMAAPYAADFGLQVNGLASPPYVTAVGGTDFAWQTSPSTYWSTSNNPTTGESALGYIPETPWNGTCTNTFLANGDFGYTDVYQFCNAADVDATYYQLVNIVGGSGGVSGCTTPSGTDPSTCSGGYAKPSWQTGTGVPADGKRDIPDVSLFASSGFVDAIPGSSYLICITGQGASSCDYSNSSQIIYQEVGGTSVATPAMAGIMALVNQKQGSAQGLANPVLYKLFGEENVSSCNSNTVANGNSCVFYDTTISDNAMPCIPGSPNCDVENAGDSVGIVAGYNATTGYDEATGLGSVNAYNLVTKWPASASKVATTTTLTASPNPAAINANVTLTATVKKNSGSGNPTGSVTFAVDGTTLTTQSLTNGVATVTGVQFSSAGTYSITAAYGGDSADDASTSSTFSLTINAAGKSNSTTSLTASPNPVTKGSSLKLTATAHSSGSNTPTGSVSFKLGSTTLGSANLSGGVATLNSTITLAAGTYSAVATYGGDSNNNGSTSSSVSVTVSSGTTKVNTTTALTVSPNPVVVNGSAKLTATVHKSSGSGTPTGTVTFYYQTESLGSAALNGGTASLTATAAVPAGVYALTASYGGDSSDNSSNSPAVNVTVNSASKTATTTTATASPNPVKVNAAATITAHVTGGSTPTGTVSFSADGTALGTASLSNGFGTISATAAVPAGTYAITITYSGDSTHDSSTGTLNVTVN